KKYKIINEVDNINLINRKNRFTILKELKNEYNELNRGIISKVDINTYGKDDEIRRVSDE
ncbi:MAG: hypothetical protein ABF289_01335, partial [Clostridiales bacterium]